MKTWIAATLVACLACAAQAKPAPLAPEKLRLAHEIMVEQGSIEVTRRQLATMFEGAARLSASVGGPQSAIADAVNKRMQQDIVRLVPEMMIDVEASYARHLSEDELRAMLAWVKSPQAKSITAKLPVITREAMASQQPRMGMLMRGAMSAAIDAVCQERSCTNEDRKAIEAMMQRMFPGPAPAI